MVTDPLYRTTPRWSSMKVEQRACRIVDENAQMLIPWVLLAAYAYNKSFPIVSDAVYDDWCRRLHRVWDRVKHRHKELIIRGPTQCMVMLNEDQYPGIVAGSATRLMIENGAPHYVPTAADRIAAAKLKRRSERKQLPRSPRAGADPSDAAARRRERRAERRRTRRSAKA